MKPLLAVVAHVNVVLRNIFGMACQRSPRLIVAAHIGGILVTLCASSANCTLLVAVVDSKEHRIIFAADSLVYTQGEISGKRAFWNRCKIVRMNNCSFAIAGVLPRDVDFENIGRQACAEPRDLRYRADTYLRLATYPISNFARRMHDQHPKTFAERISNGEGFFHTAFFVGRENGEPAIFVRQFRADTDGSVAAKSKEYLDMTAEEVVTTGTDDAMRAYLSDYPDWEKRPALDAVKHFFEIEFLNAPTAVGPPISILEISDSGERWICPGMCKSKNDKQKCGQDTH
jgi:hypothetical protein